jgi:hypothetical protein
LPRNLPSEHLKAASGVMVGMHRIVDVKEEVVKDNDKDAASRQLPV